MERTLRSENSMVTGVIWKQLLFFFFPIMLGSLFQQLYNTVDAIVVGQFVGTDALAAVGGSASNILNLLIGFFTGVSSGATVIISQYYGANDRDGVNRALHTAMLFAVVGGAILTVFGLFATEFVLRLMDTPEDTLAGSALYLRIMFVGMIPNMIYNVGSAILRAMGDSKRPLYFLVVACLANVVLDLVFVLVFKMGIAGVAIASIMAQAISAVMVIMSLSSANSEFRFYFKQMRFEKDILSRTIKIGLPAGFQSIMYSLSNMLIQASINRFGTDTVASWVVLGKVDGVTWMILGALGVASMTFVGQNYGAGRLDRIRKSLKLSLLIGGCITGGIGAILLLFGRPLFKLFTTDAIVLDMAIKLLTYFAPFYWLFVPIEIFSGALRGMGDTLIPTIITATGICVFRVVWIYTVVPVYHSMLTVSLSYPISWVLTSAAFIVYYLAVRKKLIANAPKPAALD
jgi:putative MATE family efflux protein